MKTTALRAAAAILAALALPASAKTYYVDDATGSDANTGLAADKAFKTIQKAIDKAAAGSTILVAPGTYAPIRMTKKLTIKSTDGADKTIIDGSLGEKYVPAAVEPGDDDETIWLAPAPKGKITKKTFKSGSWKYVTKYETRIGEVRCTEACVTMGKLMHQQKKYIDEWGDGDKYFSTNFVSVAATVSGFTLANAPKGVWGGTASYCTITGIDGSPVCLSTLTDSEVFDNDARPLFDTFGAIATASTLNRCDVHDNRVSGFFDGEQSNQSGIDDRFNGGDGAFFYCKGGVYNCLVHDNAVDGLYDKDYAVPALVYAPVYNSTIVSNTLSDAIAVRGDTFDSIVWGNQTPGGDPANVRLAVDEKTGATVAADYMNRSEKSEWSDSYYEYKAYNTMMYSDVEGIVVEQRGNKGRYASNSFGNISDDPLFVDAAHGDYRLSMTSPCANAGADYTKKTGKFDLDSAARKVGKVDMGAYEIQPNVAVPADYDGDGKTDPAFYFAASGQWWIYRSRDGFRSVSLPDANATPCPGNYDGSADGSAEPAYFTAAAKKPEFVWIDAGGNATRAEFGAKGATPVAVRFPGDAQATFGVYTANAKKPAFSFVGEKPAVAFGAKASRPVVADFDKDGADDFGVYTATASKPAFSILQSNQSQPYSTANLFNGGPVALGPKGAIPCCADFDGDGKADFGVYTSNTKDPCFQRLLSSAKFRETLTLPVGHKGDVPVVGVYESGQPAAPAVWTGTKWTYVDSSFEDVDLVLD